MTRHLLRLVIDLQRASRRPCRPRSPPRCLPPYLLSHSYPVAVPAQQDEVEGGGWGGAEEVEVGGGGGGG